MLTFEGLTDDELFEVDIYDLEVGAQKSEPPPANWRDHLITMCDGVELYFTQRAVWTKDYKYVYNGFDFDELYDLRKDPHEMVNVSDEPAYEDIKRDLVRKYWRFAEAEKDKVLSRYITISLFPWGPIERLKEDPDAGRSI